MLSGQMNQQTNNAQAPERGPWRFVPIQRLLLLVMVALLSLFGPLACVLHCSFMSTKMASAPIGFVCQFGHSQQQNMEQGQTPLPHYSPPGLLPFAQLAIPETIDLLGLCGMLLLIFICFYVPLHIAPPNPPPRPLLG